MAISIRELIDGILSQKRLFAFLIALSIVFCSLGLKMQESYTAEIVIKYINDSAEEGLTENGKEIDPYGINSPIVVKNAVADLGLKEAYVEGICRNITVSPITPTSEKEKYASWIEKFSDYEKTEETKKYTVYYSVKYTTPNGKDYAKRMLSAVINRYRMFFVEKYTYVDDVAKLSGEAVEQYDYYETVDIIRRAAKENMEYLSSLAASDTDYRSPRTGYSLLDLVEEYKSLSEQDLSVAERTIIENGVTKNVWYLRNSLQNKAKDALTSEELHYQKAQTQRSLMDVYSQKNEQYLWDKNDRNEDEAGESPQVRESVERDKSYAQTKSVYDSLVLDYVTYRTDALNDEIDRQRYENDINSFTAGFDNIEEKNKVELMIANICEKYNDLYEKTEKTVDDYSSYKSAKSIESISGVVAQKSTSTMFYYVVGIVLALMLGVVISVLMIYIKKTDTDETKTDADGE